MWGKRGSGEGTGEGHCDGLCALHLHSPKPALVGKEQHLVESAKMATKARERKVMSKSTISAMISAGCGREISPGSEGPSSRPVQQLLRTLNLRFFGTLFPPKRRGLEATRWKKGGGKVGEREWEFSFSCNLPLQTLSGRLQGRYQACHASRSTASCRSLQQQASSVSHPAFFSLFSPNLPLSHCSPSHNLFSPHKNTGHAVYIRGQFYNVIIHLATSKISVTLLGNAGLVVLLLVAQVHTPHPLTISASPSDLFRGTTTPSLIPSPPQVMRHLFLGPIRAAEMDRLYEKRYLPPRPFLPLPFLPPFRFSSTLMPSTPPAAVPPSLTPAVAQLVRYNGDMSGPDYLPGGDFLPIRLPPYYPALCKGLPKKKPSPPPRPYPPLSSSPLPLPFSTMAH